jgi:hypothetical protein
MGPTSQRRASALDTSGSGRKLGWSTQNEALAALLFLYEHVLERRLTDFIQVRRNIRVGLNHRRRVPL